MKYIITESQYNLINEQVKKIDLTKDNVETFCKPQPVPKEIIDREVPNLTSKIKSTIETPSITGGVFISPHFFG